MVLEQELDHGAVSILSGGVNWNPAVLLAGIDRCSALKKETRGFEVANGGGGVQRHDLGRVRGHGVSGGSAFEQQACGCGLAKKAGEVEGAESVFGTGVDGGSVARACFIETLLEAIRAGL